MFVPRQCKRLCSLHNLKAVAWLKSSVSYYPFERLVALSRIRPLHLPFTLGLIQVLMDTHGVENIQANADCRWMLQGELYQGCFLIWCDEVVCILEKVGLSCLKTCICSGSAHATVTSSALMNLLFTVWDLQSTGFFCCCCGGFFVWLVGLFFCFCLLKILAHSCVPLCSWEYYACLPEDVCMCLWYPYEYSGVCSRSVPLPLHTIVWPYSWKSTVVPGSNWKSTVISGISGKKPCHLFPTHPWPLA